MDDVDRAQERIEQTVADGIRKASNAQGLKPNGFCYYCNESVQPGRVFCCKDCLLDFENEKAAMARNGVK